MHRRQRIGKPEVTSSSNSRRRRALAVGCGDGHTGGDDIQIFDGGGASCGGWCGCETASTCIRGGGINRVNHYLSGKGQDIEACQKVPAVVRHQFNQNIEDLRTKKRKTQEEYAESYNVCDEVEREFDEIERNEMRQQQKSRLPTPSSRKEKQLKCDIPIARWMMDTSVPLNAVNLAYYQPMIDAIANMGAGYKGPNYGRVRGYLLSKLVEDVKKMIKDYRTVLLKSVDASHVSKTAEALFKLLRDVVLFVGLENVVHVVMDNAANYVDTGRLLELEFPRLYWSPCAAHCVNLMLQDIGKLEEVSEIVSQASMITNILAQKDALRAMVTSREWTSSAYSKEAKAKKFVDQVLDSKFWNQCTYIVKLTEPLVRVLRIVDNEDRAVMGFLYQAIYKAREEMLKRNRMRKKSYDPICRDAFEDHSKWIMEDSPPFSTPEEVDALRNDLANMSLQSALDDLDQLNLEDYRDDDEANNNFVKNINLNETNQNVASDLSDKERYPNFEVTPWI
ncbi:uncharacterized protein LOC107464559 [Arachis duranensis]|uniref:Uncharacterized protein LOC107464559 n=1 Tax=Arachis duranensis TaxID=130453 RepID=A0A6P4BFI7_ARADU|nr:uncharacterized protein LOC107464559 [Arachis duranensis]